MERDIRVVVGDRVRVLRRARNMSQEKLALACGLDRTYITSVENGRRNISIINLEKVASALGVSLAEFFGDKDLRPRHGR